MKLLTLLIGVSASFILNAQTDSIPQPPYKRFPTPPPFRLLMTDSSTFYTKADLPKKTPLFLIAFSPDCDHCKKETEDLITHIDDFKKIQVVMATWLPFADMKKFYNDFELYKYDNIKVGYDVSFIIPPFYNIRNLPFLALYDKKGNLITIAEGSIPMTRVLEMLKEK